MSITASLFQLYRKRPSLALEHMGKAARIIAQGGPRLLLERLHLVSGVAGRDARRRIETEFAIRQLAQLPLNARRNREALLRELMPHVDDPQVVNAMLDRDRQLRLANSHILTKYGLLDGAHYASAYLNGNGAVNPVDHYLAHGLKAGLRPNPYFDPAEYVSSYPDIASYGMDPVIHYALFGWREGRSAGSFFDADFYLEANPDVARAGISPFVHFLQHGRFENRAPTRRERDRANTLARDAGTIILVSHDAELGGAQQVLRVFAEWVLASTKYEVKLVTMRSGAFASSFREISDTFDIGAQPEGMSEDELSARLRDWAGGNVKAVFLNSAVSGGFLKYWREETPIVAFVHEMPKILKSYKEEFGLIRKRARTIVCGSDAVRRAIRSQYKVAEDRLETVYGFVEAIAADKLVDFDGKREAKQALGIDADTFLVAGCGVLHWRKSPELFIEVAREVIQEHGVAARFVWVGGGPDQAQCERLVSEHGLERHVVITGYEPDIMRWLRAADLFLLPSEEDPFPLVCLYAALALAPVVCFEKAGGMPEFVARGCGRAVPFKDTGAMAAAVLDYADDEALRRDEGAVGRALVEAEFTIRTTGPQLLHHIREAASLKPYLSVVVPNYNYETFLPERLQSIADQGFQDFELILLDDRSKDGSLTILEEWGRKRPGTRVIVNEKNSGSPFSQWLRGMELARGELIWIAEADDSCKPELLATLLPAFEDRNVFLGYVKSVPVGPKGEIYGDYETSYLDRIAPGRWAQPYLATDQEEADNGLGIANCIPNASSAIFRRFRPEPEFADRVKAMRICGDWYFYLRAMRGGLVAYSEKPLNLHRRHPETVTRSTEGTSRYFDEFASVRAYIAANYDQADTARETIRRFTLEDLDRFGVKDAALREEALAAALPTGSRKTMPAVLVVVSDLSPGGGQMFGIRLANAWSRRGGRVVLLNVRHFPDHPRVVANIDPRVTLYHADTMEMTFSELVRRYGIDVVHSSIWWADRHVHEHIGALPDLPWVITMHGCYETILDNPQTDLSFGTRVPEMLERASAWVYTAQKNRRVFAEISAPRRETNVLNGYEVVDANPLPRGGLGLREEATVLCLATRAIEEKGWFDAVEMVERLNEAGRAVDLMLIGEGPAADTIKARAPRHVHLYGQVDNLQDYITAADIGLLPTFFIGESMPLVLLEMMARGKPVVATDAGEIEMMLGTGQDAGGIIVPLKQGKVDVEGFVEAVGRLLDEKRRMTVGRSAEKRFAQLFTMESMIGAYLNEYAYALNGKDIKKD